MRLQCKRVRVLQKAYEEHANSVMAELKSESMLSSEIERKRLKKIKRVGILRL